MNLKKELTEVMLKKELCSIFVVDDFESDHKANVSFPQREKICLVLDCTANDVLEFFQEPPEHEINEKTE